MMRNQVHFVALLGLAALAACASRQRFGYTLPPNADVDALHAHILSCANEQNLNARMLLSRLWVNVDADTLLIYNLNAPENKRMTVRLDSRYNTEDEKDRLFSAAKAVGDDLMMCAQERAEGP